MINDFSRLINVQCDDGTDENIQLNIWDAAGMSDVHHLAHLFLKDVQVAVLVFDITSKKSFEELD